MVDVLICNSIHVYFGNIKLSHQPLQKIRKTTLLHALITCGLFIPISQPLDLERPIMSSIVQNDYTRKVVHENIGAFAEFQRLGGILEQDEIEVAIGNDSALVTEKKNFEGKEYLTHPLPVKRFKTHFVLKLAGRRDFVEHIVKAAREVFAQQHGNNSVKLSPNYLRTTIRGPYEYNRHRFDGVIAIPVENVFDNPFAKPALSALSEKLVSGLYLLSTYNPKDMAQSFSSLLGLKVHLSKDCTTDSGDFLAAVPLNQMPDAVFARLKDSLTQAIDHSSFEIDGHSSTGKPAKKSQNTTGVPRFRIQFPAINHMDISKKLSLIQPETERKIQKLVAPYAPTPKG